MMMSGRVLSVETVTAGADVLEAASVGASSVVLVDAVGLDPAGGQVVLPSGQVAAYTSVDLDADVVTFAEPLPVALVEADRLSVTPVASWTQAVVELSDGGEVVPVRVPHTMQSSMPVGVRAEGGEIVDVEQREDGRFWLHEVRDEPPHEVWGDPDGAAAEMRPSGLSFYTVGGPDGRWEATRLGSGEDRLGVFNAEGQIVGGVTADGSLVGQSGVVAGDFSVGGVPLLGRLWDNSPGAPQGWLERLAAGLVVNASFPDGAPERPPAELWGYAKVGFTARAGRAYKIRVEQQFLLITSGTVFVRMLYTTDGSEPTVGTAQQIGQPVESAAGSTVAVERLFMSPVDAPVRVLVVNNSTTQAHRVLRAVFTVEDLGPQGTYGGGTYTTGREATPPPTVREYTSTWTATGFRVYDETTQPVDAAQPRQYGDPTGRRDYTAILFDGAATHGSHAGETMTSATTGATITKAEVFLANTSWGGGDAGHIALGKGGVAALPPTLEPQATVQPSVPTGAGAWIEVPTTWFNDTNRVVTLGDVDGGVQGGWFMAPTDELPPLARLTYTL